MNGATICKQVTGAVTLIGTLALLVSSPTSARDSVGAIRSDLTATQGQVDTNTDAIEANQDAICELYYRTDVTPEPDFCDQSRIVFLTVGAWQGFEVGGASGADAKCQNEANSAGLSGTFLAWISTTTSSPAADFAQSVAPYRRRRGNKVAEDWADLTDGSLRAPINQSAQGATLEFSLVWTATDTNGSLLNPNCNDWASTGPAGRFGYSDYTSGAWTSFGTASCTDQLGRLYCIEQ